MENQINMPCDLKVDKWNKYYTYENEIVFECSTGLNSRMLYFSFSFPDEHTVKYSFRWTARPDSGRESIRENMLQNRNCSYQTFYSELKGEYLLISTGTVNVKVYKEPFYFTVSDAKGNEFFSKAIPYITDNGNIQVLPSGFENCNAAVGSFAAYDFVKVDPDEDFYGFGEIFSQLNKRGSVIDSWATAPNDVVHNKAYKNIPFFMSTKGYGLFIYSTARIIYDMAAESQEYYRITVHEDEFSAYVIYGPEFKTILKRYCDLTGYAPVLPKYSFGLWMSKCCYINRSEVEEVCRRLRERRIPCDVVHIDPYWMGEPDKWCSMEWNREYFPDPAGMMDNLSDSGFKVCLWENSYVPDGTGMYEEGEKNGYFVKNPDGSVYTTKHWYCHRENVNQAYVDFTNPEAVDWYKQKHRDILSNIKAAAFKTDFGEDAPADGIYKCGLDGRLIHNIYPLLYNKTVFDVLKEFLGEDALVWARSAYAGSQRFPVFWGGDPKANFINMAAQLRGILSLGMSGIPFASHDIGGFNGLPGTNLYIRWAQFGLFSSHSRCHGLYPKEPWEYGEEAERCFREAAELRYSLLPYIYSEACSSSFTGLPMLRPMVMEFQHDLAMRNIDLQYMFGRSLLVAPVLNEENTATVVLPKGTWHDLWSGRIIKGPCQITDVYPLDRFPLFVREGAIVPVLGKKLQYIGNQVWDSLYIHIYDGRNGQFEIYDKIQGVLTCTKVSLLKTGKIVNITIENNPGADLVVYYHGIRPYKVLTFNDSEVKEAESLKEVIEGGNGSYLTENKTVIVKAGKEASINIRLVRKI